MKCCSKCKVDKSRSDFTKNKRYKDGLACWCKTCFRQYEIENRQKIKDRKKKYYEENKDRIRTQQKKYELQNKERKQQYHQQWYKENRIRVRAVSDQWYRDNKGRVLANTRKYQAKKLKAVPIWLTEADIQYMQWLYEKCRQISLQTGVKHHVDHIDPLQGQIISGLHCPLNLRIVTATENLQKSNK